MTPTDQWSPDDSSGDQPFEQGDEALDDTTALDPDFLEEVELDPSLDPTLVVDDRELGEAGAQLDDPEVVAMLDGGIDDPDGISIAQGGRRVDPVDDVGWDLDAPVTRGDLESDAEAT